VLSLVQRAQARGLAAYCLTRGYGGSLAGPVAVDPKRHTAAVVGDEALLLAEAAPSWVARDRVAGAAAAAAAGAQLVILDDGFQNPRLAKDLALLVIDGAYGFGNGRLIPAGPLREPIAAALARADAIVLLGADEAGIAPQLGTTPILHGRLAPVGDGEFVGVPVVAFAGIGRPEKFFRTLTELGARILGRHAFADHHRYTDGELAALADEAARTGARLITTVKDAVRLPPHWRERVAVLKVEIAWQDEAAVATLLDRLHEAGPRHG
jgi:tetraacyldisaccharide 4'-kinase